jgi:hypothetical protein
VQTRHVSRLIHSLVGWIFWDPGAERRYEAMGVPGRLGYIGGRAAPLACAGDDAIIAAFSTIHPSIVRGGLGIVRAKTTFEAMWQARDEAVVEGLRAYLTPEQASDVASLAAPLWRAVEACPVEGRTFFAAHLARPRPGDALLSAWDAANAVREWRGDNHMALLVAYGLDAPEASILHSAWMRYEHDWVPRSRGWGDADIAAAFERLGRRGLADGNRVNGRGLELREEIERRTDEISARPWETLGFDETQRICAVLEPIAPALLARIDATAGANWMPAARVQTEGVTTG